MDQACNVNLVVRHMRQRIPKLAERTTLELDLLTADAELEIADRIEDAPADAFETGWNERGWHKEDAA
jgi:hypothetical protein